jgi:hypothetical protein
MRHPALILAVSAPLFFLFLAPAVFAQSLQAEVSPSSDGHPIVTLTNTYTADARAYIVECDYTGPKGETLSVTVAHDGIDGPPYTVQAGKSEQIACPMNTESAEVKAAAYDDGKTEGDSQFLARIAAERQVEIQDVAADIQILQNALPSLANPTASQTGAANGATPNPVNQLRLQFVQRAQENANTALSPIPRDWVCTGIARMLGSPINKQPIAARIQGYIEELQKFAAVLAKSAQ